MKGMDFKFKVDLKNAMKSYSIRHYQHIDVIESNKKVWQPNVKNKTKVVLGDFVLVVLKNMGDSRLPTFLCLSKVAPRSSSIRL